MLGQCIRDKLEVGRNSIPGISRGPTANKTPNAKSRKRVPPASDNPWDAYLVDAPSKNFKSMTNGASMLRLMVFTLGIRCCVDGSDWETLEVSMIDPLLTPFKPM